MRFAREPEYHDRRAEERTGAAVGQGQALRRSGEHSRVPRVARVFVGVVQDVCCAKTIVSHSL